MNTFLRLIQLLWIAKQHHTPCRRRDRQHIRERHLAGFIHEQHVD